MFKTIFLSFFLLLVITIYAQQPWQSKYVKINADGTLQYFPDELGNTIPDFSRVGYYQGKMVIPPVPIVITLSPTNDSNHQQLLQSAIDELSKKQPDKNGFRGTILLKKGTYLLPQTIFIKASGIVLRGEGNDTKLIATGKGQRSMISVSGIGNIKEVLDSRRKITDTYVPTGIKSLNISSVEGLKVGDKIIVFRPGTQQWITDLKMDQIDIREGVKQWQPDQYNMKFERTITAIKGNAITIDNPIVMQMETKYGGGEIYKYSFVGRVANVGIENLYCESEFAANDDEDHGWKAIDYEKVENGWVKNVTSKYFGYSCVSLGNDSKQITVDSCTSLDPKSKIEGGRRYSFNNDGQLNLFKNCFASEGRHDFVTGAQVRGPNVFFNCKAEKTHADIGPHHRWAMGTLYDNISSDGEINAQDRGNWGTGHGWSGITQVFWNCTASKTAIQNPWVSGKNYVIGLQGSQYAGRLPGRLSADYEGMNKKGLQPTSLYLIQLQNETKINKH